MLPIDSSININHPHLWNNKNLSKPNGLRLVFTAADGSDDVDSAPCSNDSPLMAQQIDKCTVIFIFLDRFQEQPAAVIEKKNILLVPPLDFTFLSSIQQRAIK